MMIAFVVVLVLCGFVIALWVHGVSAGIIDLPGEAAESRRAQQKVDERESRLTATELWAERPWGAAPSADFQKFLVAKYGDTRAAVDAWEAAGRKPDGYTELAREMIDWHRNKG
jgi:hypothetical protein